jgi:hypothetical protein
MLTGSFVPQTCICVEIPPGGKAGRGDAGTGLPNNRACLLIGGLASPEGDLHGVAANGKAP